MKNYRGRIAAVLRAARMETIDLHRAKEILDGIHAELMVAAQAPCDATREQPGPTKPTTKTVYEAANEEPQPGQLPTQADDQRAQKEPAAESAPTQAAYEPAHQPPEAEKTLSQLAQAQQDFRRVIRTLSTIKKTNRPDQFLDDVEADDLNEALSFLYEVFYGQRTRKQAQVAGLWGNAYTADSERLWDAVWEGKWR